MANCKVKVIKHKRRSMEDFEMDRERFMVRIDGRTYTVHCIKGLDVTFERDGHEGCFSEEVLCAVRSAVWDYIDKNSSRWAYPQGAYHAADVHCKKEFKDCVPSDMTRTKRVIWKPDYECDPAENDIDDERINLDIATSHPIIAIADTGRWDGRRNAYKMLGQNIKNCLYSEEEATWYIGEDGEFHCTENHHDGINFILYREMKDISEKQFDNFLDKVFKGDISKKTLNRYTTSLGPAIKEVYGW